MKKISLLLIILLFAVAASGGYGYYAFVLNEDDDSNDENQTEGNLAPNAVIDPTKPKIQVDSSINFTASKSTDPNNDVLSYVWTFEGDNREYEGEVVERNYPDEGEFEVKLIVFDSGGLSDETVTIVTVVSNYHGEFSGSLNEGQSESITFPVQAGAISLDVDWNLTDGQQAIINLEPSTVDMYLEDSEGNVLENETGEQEGSGSWSINGDSLEPSGDYLIVIECTNGEMEYEIVINVKY